MIKKYFLVLLIFIGSIYAQITQFGIGAPIFFYTYTPTIMLPINIADQFLIQPEFLYSKDVKEYNYYTSDDDFYNDYNDFTREETTVNAMIGIYKTWKKSSAKIHLGFKIGMGSEKSDTEYDDSDIADNLNHEEESDFLLFGPSINIEYFILNNFSLGIESSMLRLNQEEDIPPYYYSSNTDNIGEIDNVQINGITRLLIKLYF